MTNIKFTNFSNGDVRALALDKFRYNSSTNKLEFYSSIDDTIKEEIGIPNVTAPDTTLTQSGQSADAKVVGDIIGTVYSNASTYDVGDYVLYNGKIYRCKTAIETGEEWTAAHWIATNITAEINNVKAELEDEVSELKSDLNKIATIQEPVNFFNGEWDTGYVITNGSVTPDAGFTCSKLQTLKAGTYLIPCLTNTFGTNANRCYRYQADGTFIDYIEATLVSGTIYKFTLTGTYSCRFNIGNRGEVDTYMIVKGETIDDYPSQYVPHTDEAVVINPDAIIPSILSGKKLCCDGDSIMYGAGFVGGFAKLIAENNGMTLQNLAVSGATIRSGTTWSDGENRHWICESIANLDADGDYYIFDGWVNDVHSQTVIGSVSWGYSATLDTTTFCGAFEQCCKTLATMFAGKKVGYVFTHRIWKPTDTLAPSYIDKMIEILNKWGIPYINLMELDPPINEIASLKSAYTKDGDGWHPNEQGYRLFYVDKITAWMKTL